VSICLLSVAEAGRLEHWKTWPRCVEHRHLSRCKADEQAAAGLVRFLTGPDGRPLSMVVPAGEVAMWQPVQVCNVDGSKIHGLRVWGNAPSR
jgi:hypothetical protein